MSSATPPQSTQSTRGSAHSRTAQSPADKGYADDWDLLASVVSEPPPPLPPPLPPSGSSSSSSLPVPLISSTPISSTPMRVLAGPVPASSSFTASEWRAADLSSSTGMSSMSFGQGSPRTTSLAFPPPVLVTRSALAAHANPSMESHLLANETRVAVPSTSEQSLSHPGSWQIVLVNNDARQIVLYNRRSHALAIQTAHSPVSSPTHSTAVSAPPHSPNAVALSWPPPHDLRHHVHNHPCCPMCGRAFSVGQLPALSSTMSGSQFGSEDQDDGDNGEMEDPMDVDQVHFGRSPASGLPEAGVGGGQMVPVVAMPTYQDRDYFRLLANVHSTYPIASTASVASSPPDSPVRTSSPDPFSTSSSVVGDLHNRPPTNHPTTTAAAATTTSTTPTSPTPGVNATSFNQGYYSRFFHELGKLGRGAHGAVYLCRHVLDDIPLGEYAIKKVAVGNNHPWLSRLLREVTLLERLRHPNIIAYKHAWLEHAQHSAFGPLVPSLFILMERANGGNLEDFLLPEGEEAPDAAGGGKAAAVKARKRAARVSALPKLPAAWAEIGAKGGWAVGQHGRIVRVLGTKSVVKLVLGVARGLDHLHKLGVVHRDLKPPNILLSWESDQGIPVGTADTSDAASPGSEAGPQDDGVVPQDSIEPGAVPPTNKVPIPLIADFGEFDVISNPSAADRTGNTGTIDFTAPECLKRDHVTGRFLTTYSTKADVWSLGLIALYVAFAGHVPFVHRADVDKLREEILACNPTSLVGEMAAGVHPQRVPKAFMALVAQCLSKEPGQRPTAGKVVHVLERLLAQVEGENGAGAAGDEDPMDVDTALGMEAAGVDVFAGASVETQGARRGRSNTFAASTTSTKRSASAFKTTWDFGDLQPASAAGEASTTTIRSRTTRAVSTSGARLRPIPSSSIDSSLELEEPAQVPLPLPALPPPSASVSFNTWIAAGARIAQVAALLAVPPQVPTNISVALTCCALATTEWLATTATTATTAPAPTAGPSREADHVRTGVLGGLIVHFVALAGVSWAYASGRAG